MKKLLFLGGSDIQIPGIKYAKSLGYYVITCDYLPDNPGHKFSDKYYDISTTDLDGVLEIAKKEKISISKAINKYQNKNITKTQKNPVPYGQHDWQHKLKDIKNPNLLVNVKDSSGKIYRFTGTGKEIAENPNFILLKTRNLNRIYTAIKKRK